MLWLGTTHTFLSSGLHDLPPDCQTHQRTNSKLWTVSPPSFRTAGLLHDLQTKFKEDSFWELHIGASSLYLIWCFLLIVDGRWWSNTAFCGKISSKAYTAKQGLLITITVFLNRRRDDIINVIGTVLYRYSNYAFFRVQEVAVPYGKCTYFKNSGTALYVPNVRGWVLNLDADLKIFLAGKQSPPVSLMYGTSTSIS